MTKRRYFYMFDLKDEKNDIIRTIYERIDEEKLISELSDVLSDVNDDMPKSLAATIRYYAHKKNMKGSQICFRAGLDPRYFGKLVRKDKPIQHPTKFVLLALCFGLQLDFEESTRFMEFAGSSFNPCNRFDVACAYMLRRRVFDMNVVNNILTELELPCFAPLC